jgi:nitrogen fixation NifU-like protein
MEDEFNDSARGLQQQMLQETRKAYGQVAFERWLKPLYVGTISRPDGYARVSGSRGDTMELYLRFGGNRVKEATFQTNGCGAGIVCGSFAAELSIGKNPEEIAQISGEIILRFFGDLPEEDRHCAFLAAETLQEAVGRYLKQNRKRATSGRKKRQKKEQRGGTLK